MVFQIAIATRSQGHLKSFGLRPGISEHFWLGLCFVHSQLHALQHDVGYSVHHETTWDALGSSGFMGQFEVQHIGCIPCSNRGAETSCGWWLIHGTHCRAIFPSPMDSSRSRDILGDMAGLWTGMGILPNAQPHIVWCLCCAQLLFEQAEHCVNGSLALAGETRGARQKPETSAPSSPCIQARGESRVPGCKKCRSGCLIWGNLSTLEIPISRSHSLSIHLQKVKLIQWKSANLILFLQEWSTRSGKCATSFVANWLRIGLEASLESMSILWFPSQKFGRGTYDLLRLFLKTVDWVRSVLRWRPAAPRTQLHPLLLRVGFGTGGQPSPSKPGLFCAFCSEPVQLLNAIEAWVRNLHETGACCRFLSNCEPRKCQEG